ncbi:sucrase-isomaltase, intestinal-like [Agelaius tricolor]|uniref:sucrase-isomaltase, intestinal-like n=1 Tax=Agelaius tricolor TaxID=9191 RepID=UPI0039F1F09D
MPDCVSVSPPGLELALVPLPAPLLFGAPLGSVRLRAQLQSPTRLRLQFTDAREPRFEVPEEVVGPFPGTAAPEPQFRLKFQENPFGVQVLRASTGRVIFDTTVGPLLLSDQFLSLSSRLSCSALYSPGQRRLRLRPGWHRWGLYSSQGQHGENAEEGQNLAGVHPFLLCLEDTSGASLGIFLLNSNAMELSVSPAPLVTFSTIGGSLDLFLLLGNSPQQVLQEHAKFGGEIREFWGRNSGTLGVKFKNFGREIRKFQG